jgi:hypothetical protein
LRGLGLRIHSGFSAWHSFLDCKQADVLEASDRAQGDSGLPEFNSKGCDEINASTFGTDEPVARTLCNWRRSK